MACPVAAAAMIGAPAAGADPADLVFTHQGHGTNPQTPLGLTPGEEPAV